MPHYHVIAKTKTDDNYIWLFKDLSEEDLKGRFVSHYRRGKSFFAGNDLISPSDLKALQIVCTKYRLRIEQSALNHSSLNEIDMLNRGSADLFFISPGRGYEPQDIVEAGEDVTHTYIKGPPGSKIGFLVPSLNVVKWVLGIAAAVIAAGIAKHLGYV